MTATAIDTKHIAALTRQDATVKARWAWEPYFRLVRVIEVEPSTHAGVWRVTAELELVRP